MSFCTCIDKYDNKMKKRTIYDRFSYWAELQPDAIAVVEDGRSITYRELNNLTNAIMSKFYSKQYSTIGIVMSHRIEMIAAILAVLKSGGAYVPAEPSLPQARIDYMMQTAGVKFIITDNYCRDIPQTKLLMDRSVANGVAYVLYTSGTSGRPKGVVVENHSVVNYAEAFENEFHIGAGDVMLQYSICSFDIFVEEVFATLLNGATLAIPSKEIHDGNLSDLMAFCEKHNVTVISGFPYLLADMNRHRCCPAKLRLLISGGDVIRATYITWLKRQRIVIYNTYGPSETTVCATYFRIDNTEALEDGTYSIGKSVKGGTVKILDENLHEVPDGKIGEICILGEGVSRGYLGDTPEQTNFVSLSDGTQMFRSGDLGYRRPDHNIAFLHRKDKQVMILGRRVEPEEVENVLNESPCVERGIVRAFTDEQDLAYLTAYFVPSHKNCQISCIKNFLRSRLSDFMVPEFFVKMDDIPLTPRGKVNDRLLPVVMKEGITK